MPHTDLPLLLLLAAPPPKHTRTRTRIPARTLVCVGIQREVTQESQEVTREHIVYVKRERESMCRKFEWW